MNYNIFQADGELVAMTAYAEDAAAIVAILGEDATVETASDIGSMGGRVLWTEGKEEFSAAESYDGAAAIMEQRENG